MTLHICGCKTRFDTVTWRSITLRRCDFHKAQEAKFHPPEEDRT